MTDPPGEAKQGIPRDNSGMIGFAGLFLKYLGFHR
jgi:hypothetical protein